MADYLPIISGAVAALDPNTATTRKGVYDRARTVLIERLRASDPPVSEGYIASERSALEAVIREVEAGATGRIPAAAPLPTVERPEPVPPVRMTSPPRRSLALGPIAMGVAAIAIAAVAVGAVYQYWPRSKAAPARRAEPAPAQISYIFLRQPVYYRTTHPVGSVIVDKSQHFLYLVRPNVVALRYGIGLGPECSDLAGLYRVLRKEEWPGWQASGSARPADRLASPLGARAVYLDRDHRIHGTNQPATIGQLVSMGCIRLANNDVIDLYERVNLESRVIVVN